MYNFYSKQPLIDHLFPTFESSTNEPISVAPIDEEALAEARAEAGMVDDSTPDMGYYKSEHSRWYVLWMTSYRFPPWG